MITEAETTKGISIMDQEKCTKQNVQTVEMNAKFHLNQQKANQYIAENVSANTGNTDSLK